MTIKVQNPTALNPGIAMHQGDFHRAITLLERALPLSQEANIPIYFSIAAACLALTYARCGRAADALALVDQGVGQTGFSNFRLALAGETYRLVGRLENARRLALRTLEDSRNHKERGLQAQLLRLLGEIAATSDSLAEAEAHYRQALTLAEALGMRALLAHCHLGLGKIYLKSERRDSARHELSTALDLYRAMGMTFWLPQAEATLAEVEGR
jgi:tetratricopeptide (TPR) repeat protein